VLLNFESKTKILKLVFRDQDSSLENSKPVRECIKLKGVIYPIYKCTLGQHSKVGNVYLMEALYTDTCSCVCADGMLSDWFAVGSGIQQGYRVVSDLFLGPMDHMMERTAH